MCHNFHVSRVTCPLSLTSTATATDPPPVNSPIMLSEVVRKYPKTHFLVHEKLKKSLKCSKKSSLPKILSKGYALD